MTFTVYALWEMGDLPYYVGVSRNLKSRRAAHGGPLMSILEIVEGEKRDALARERHWILRLRAWGCPLRNVHPVIGPKGSSMVWTVNVKVKGDLYRAVVAKAASETERTGYTVTISDVVKRALAEYVK